MKQALWLRAPGLVLRWKQSGVFEAAGLPSGQEVEIGPDAVSLLDSFGKPCDIDATVNAFVDSYSNSDPTRAQLLDQVRALVREWQRVGLLIPAGSSQRDEISGVDDGAMRWRVVPEFFDGAQVMRAAFERRFGPPYSNTGEREGWEYVSTDLYRYLRTDVQSVLLEELYSRFIQRLRQWGSENLACPNPLPVSMNCHVDGYWHGLHADIYEAYDWAFVFSLTDWETRSFAGGETVMLAPRAFDYWHGFEYASTVHEDAVLEEIPPKFNQLTVFDPRIPHGVRAVSGARDLLKGRLTIIGHLGVPQLVVSDSIADAEERWRFEAVMEELRSSLQSVTGVSGAAVARIDLTPKGKVADARILATSLRSTTHDESVTHAVMKRMLDFLRDVRLPPLPEGAWANFPLRLPQRVGD